MESTIFDCQFFDEKKLFSFAKLSNGSMLIESDFFKNVAIRPSNNLGLIEFEIKLKNFESIEISEDQSKIHS